MLTINDWQALSVEERKQALNRPTLTTNIKNQVKTIINAVKTGGDNALVAFSREFDKVELKSLQVSVELIDSATISPEANYALKQAITTISAYHQAMMPTAQRVATASGICIERVYRPISRVGLYVPGGNNTPLISSLLMQAIPAKTAGCPIKVLCTPPNSQGLIDPHLLVAARLCDIDTIYLLGGAQAIAAMAYGTETISKVDKIFGPGNNYVTEAKNQISCDPMAAAIDMPAGPSEVMVFADDHANPAFVAADLLAQAEHGIDSQVILICESRHFAEQVNQQLNEQLRNLSRQAIINQALQKSVILLCKDRIEQLAIINHYAPEHLIINRFDADSWVADISSAGTIFLGPWAAETMGDYVTGSNHVLPTNGYARNHNGLSTVDFLKSFSVQSITTEGLEHLGETAKTLAMLEGLDAHAKAITLRLEQINKRKR